MLYWSWYIFLYLPLNTVTCHICIISYCAVLYVHCTVFYCCRLYCSIYGVIICYRIFLSFPFLWLYIFKILDYVTSYVYVYIYIDIVIFSSSYLYIYIHTHVWVCVYTYTVFYSILFFPILFDFYILFYDILSYSLLKSTSSCLDPHGLAGATSFFRHSKQTLHRGWFISHDKSMKSQTLTSPF